MPSSLLPRFSTTSLALATCVVISNRSRRSRCLTSHPSRSTLLSASDARRGQRNQDGLGQGHRYLKLHAEALATQWRDKGHEIRKRADISLVAQSGGYVSIGLVQRISYVLQGESSMIWTGLKRSVFIFEF